MKNLFRGVSDAYFAGQNGEQRPADANRLARIAYGAGHIVCSHYERQNAVVFAKERARLEAAIEAAQGLNKKALEILRDNEALPDDPRRLKAWSHITEHTAGPDKGKRFLSWHTTMVYGPDDAPKGFERTPMVEPLGTLKIVDPVVDPLGAFPLAAEINHVTIAVKAPIDPWENIIGPPETRIDVNERPYDVRLNTMDIRPKFMGGATIQLNGAGEVAALGLDMSTCSGYTSADLTVRQPLVEPLLDGIHAAVLATQRAYDGIA